MALISLRGFPITVGLARAFLVLLVTVPALRVVSMPRNRHETYVPLMATTSRTRWRPA